MEKDVRLKLAYSLLYCLDEIFDFDPGTIDQFIDYASDMFLDKITVNDVEEIVDFINEEVGYPVIDCREDLSFTCTYEDLKKVMKTFKEQIHDIDFLEAFFGQTSDGIANRKDSICSTDFEEISDDGDDNYIDPMEVKKDAWGNYYSVGEQMLDGNYNRKDKDEIEY